MKSELILSLLVIPHLLAFSHPIQLTLRFLQSSIWKELDSPLNHKKGKSGAPEGHTDIVNEVHGGCPFDTVHKVLHIKLWQHAVCVN